MTDLELCNRVFVYGTLMKGHGNSRIFVRHEAEYLGSAVTMDEYVLGDVGFPYMFSEKATRTSHHEYKFPVRGDLWEIPNEACLMSLDFLEGVPSHYQRELIELSDGQVVWAYLQNDKHVLSYCYACDLNDNNEWQWS